MSVDTQMSDLSLSGRDHLQDTPMGIKNPGERGAKENRELAAEAIPGVSEYKDIYNIEQELSKEDPSLLNLGISGAGLMLGAVPVVGDKARRYIQRFKNADSFDTPTEWQESIKEVVKKERAEEIKLGTSHFNPDVHTDELEESAQRFLADKDNWNRKDHLDLIDKHKSVTPWDTMPRTPTDKAVVFALKDLQREKGFFFGLSDNVTNNLNVNKSSLKVGDKFNGRLDIPAYKKYDTWVVAGKSNQVTHYGKAMHYAPNEKTGKVSFNASTRTGEKIAADQEEKIGYAIISGNVKDLDQDNIIQRATEVIKNKDPEWTQIGFDPRRQTHFYVREGEKIHTPALAADEVIQVGPLVLAKNVKLDSDFAGLNMGGSLMRRLYATE